MKRLKGAIDNTIAQEQARQRLTHSSPSRSASTTQRSSSRNLSPSKRSARAHHSRRQETGDATTKGPDPSAFEPEFVIDDDDLSRSGTPKPAADPEAVREKPNQDPPTENDSASPHGAQEESPQRSTELPTEVRVKLRKLDKLESRYHELLRSYRIAHARVQTIEIFETSLRENTPLTSISDPNALVEYLNQLNLKSDLVSDELKRVSIERDDYKRKLGDAESTAKEAWDEVTKLKKDGKYDPEDGKEDTTASDAEEDARDVDDGDPLGATKKSSPASIKSPITSLRTMPLFSPKSKAVESPKLLTDSEDLFSFDGEIPRLESELEQKTEQIGGLEREVHTLRGDLAVARESTQSMVQTLEEATRDVNSLRDNKERSESELEEFKDSMKRTSEQLRAELSTSEEKLKSMQAEASSQKIARVEELERDLSSVTSELRKAQEALDAKGELSVELDELRKVADELRAQLTETKKRNADLLSEIEKSVKENRPSQAGETRASADSQSTTQGGTISQEAATSGAANPEAASGSKKKNKKKKKGGKSTIDQEKIASAEPSKEPTTNSQAPSSSANLETVENLKAELVRLQAMINEKDAAIDRMNVKLREQDDLREEIETLKDDLINVGQEHVDTKEKAKQLMIEKRDLEARLTAHQDEISQLQSKLLSEGDSDEKHSALANQFEELKSKAGALQTDLSAAQQLASSRFKDLNDLRTSLQKAQPEINNLRIEAAELKSVKEALAKKEAEFKRLDSRHEGMRIEMSSLKQIVSNRDTEIKSLNQKVNLETAGRLKAEDGSIGASQELQRIEAERQKATESIDRLSKELVKAREDMLSGKTRLKEMEQKISKQRSDSEGLREEVELKSAQYASAQSLMASMRDQTVEMATQLKEARERCDSLDEEVADAHRLLSERSREGETMRRLLADVDGRADTRVREMKDRMDSAIEERDRTEDEASTAGRRRAREVEELRNKCRDAERSLKRAEEDRDELELAQKDWKRRREDLEQGAERSKGEVDEVRKAMGELRDALDESERQARDLEKQKGELRRSVEDTQHRIEKLQKTNKTLSDELTKIQTTSRTKTPHDNDNQPSTRSSFDSIPTATANARLSSPPPSTSRTRNSPGGSAALMDATNGIQRQQQDGGGQMDYVYLKNVLLQFLEQKDKKHQMQLIPVLAMLLHFDRKDEQKWMSAINTKV